MLVQTCIIITVRLFLRVDFFKNNFGFGVNYSISNTNRCATIHAEHDALNDYMSRYTIHKNKKNNKNINPKVDLVVIRISKTGLIGYSRPCYDCVNMLNHSYLNIRMVYYSDENGSIIGEKFSNMIDSPKNRISSGNRKINRKCSLSF